MINQCYSLLACVKVGLVHTPHQPSLYGSSMEMDYSLGWHTAVGYRLDHEGFQGIPIPWKTGSHSSSMGVCKCLLVSGLQSVVVNNGIVRGQVQSSNM